MNMTEENNSRVSISFEVIRYITLYYFSIAVILTIGQVIFEYQHIKSNIFSAVDELSLSFNDSLTNSLWEYNDNQTMTILKGILDSPSTIGVKLTELNNKTTHNLGQTPTDQQKENTNFIVRLINPNELFEFKKVLKKTLENGQVQVVGTLYIYSGNKIILDQLSRIIFYIIVNSILKTISLWAILIMFFSRRIKKPLESLVSKIKGLDPQNPKEIDLKGAEDTIEFYQIVTSFNGLIQELNNFKEVLEAIVDNKTELLKEKNIEVRKLVNKLQTAQDQIVNQEKLNSLGLVSAGIAHELKNPLNISKNSVLILMDILKFVPEKEYDVNSIDASDLEKVPSIIEMLFESNNRMETIIRNMLLQSRTEYTKPAEINLYSFIQMNLSAVQKSLKTKSSSATRITVDIDKDQNLMVFPSELGRLLVNLFENSFFAIGEKLDICEKAGTPYKPELNASIKNFGKEKILFTVHDNGNGMPDRIKNKILEPFFTTKPTGIGTGLGLYLSYEIVKKHHGEIKINSEENVYTEIQIILPTNLESFYT